jgi:glycosyltransferase involved in cell wall biosynthesis
MHILISVTNLAPGGPSTFLLRLAKQLAAKHRVAFYDHYHYYSAVDYNRWQPVDFYYFGKNRLLDKLVWKLHALIKKIVSQSDVREWLKNLHFKYVISRFRPDLILTTQQKTDALVIDFARKMGVKVVLRLNSSYGFDDKRISNDPAAIARTQHIFSSCNGIVYTSDFHFSRIIRHIGNIATPYIKIMNGMPPVSITQNATLLLASLGIDKKTAFIFGMVSRGEREKGWEEAVAAFQMASQASTDKNLHLILVGDSEYLRMLKDKHQTETSIHFVGFSQNPPDWIQLFDVALLPTYFANESTPNVIIEYLQCGKPVIATDYVEIPHMLQTENNDIAGILVPLYENGRPDAADIARAMMQYVNNTELWQRHVNFATKAAAKFDIKKCAAEYESFFEKIISNCQL